jgi:hypothetical protein
LSSGAALPANGLRELIPRDAKHMNLDHARNTCLCPLEIGPSKIKLIKFFKFS